MRPGVGGEGGEAFGGFDVGGVVVAEEGAVAGEEAGEGEGGLVVGGGGEEGEQGRGGKRKGGTNAKWEACESTLAVRRSFIAAALSIVVWGLFSRGDGDGGWLGLLRM